MGSLMVERLVRERLRAKNGQVYCAVCLAKDLEQDPAAIKTAMEMLARRRTFRAGACPCGGRGLAYRPS